jgi:4-amino-4-deoxy-L-arabinose transferase-like glycosyltransferase
MTSMLHRFFASKRRINHLIALCLSASYLTALLVTASDVGFARDEGFYFTASRSYQKWFDVLSENPAKAFTRETVDRYWKYNHEHPALMKSLFGFSERIFHHKLKLMNPSTANRLPGMICAALILYIVFLFGAEVFDRRAGLCAALFFGLMPRVFYHAHLACFDVPITMMWILVFYLYYRSLTSWKFGAFAGIAFGLALCTKLNGFFLPFVVGFHYLCLLIYRKRQKEPVPNPSALIFGAVFGPIIFFAHWPWIWFDTWNRLLEYVGFHAGHPFYNVAWFGENIIGPPTPMLMPAGMTLFTVPSVIILLFLFGAAMRLRHHLPAVIERRLPARLLPVGPASQNGFELLWFLSFAFPIVLLSLPGVPKFGGTKHWMPAYPCMVLIAGAAASRLMDVVSVFAPKLPSKVVAAAVTILVALPPLQQTVTSHPFGLESYVPLIGGAPGAASLGMTRQFWGYTTRSVIPWMNDHFPDGAKVEIHDTTVSSWRMYQEDGILHKNLRPVRLADSDAAFLHYELHMVTAEASIWARYNTFAPTHVLTYQGVPILSIYTKPEEE